MSSFFKKALSLINWLTPKANIPINQTASRIKKMEHGGRGFAPRFEEYLKKNGLNSEEVYQNRLKRYPETEMNFPLNWNKQK